MERKNADKGFTLIELIISIAILSIVGLAIFGFMATSSSLYGRQVTQADLQYESQLVINQLQDMLIDASRSVTYIVTVGGTETEVLNDAGLSEADITQKEVRIYNGDEYYKVTWDKDEERLYYSRYVQKGESVAMAALGAGATADTGEWEADPDASHVRMADYVREFSADITDLEKNRSVKFQFLFQINNISYATQHNITLRNKVVKGIGESGEVTVVPPAQDSIKISPKNITLWPGDPLVFTHIISSKTGNFPSQEADWTLSSSETLAADTVLTADGQLQVSLDEKSREMTVTVTAREGAKQEDGSVLRPHADASVLVKQVEGLTVELAKGGSYPGEDKKPRLIPGSTLQFKTTSITGDNINSPQDLTAPGVTITWEVVRGAEYASVDDNGMLTVELSAPVGTELQVRAVFNRKSRQWAYGYSNVYKVERVRNNDFIYTDPGDSEYVAPEGEIWLEEGQKISIDPDQWENQLDPALKDGDKIKDGYMANWHVWIHIKGKGTEEGTTNGEYGWPQGLSMSRSGDNTVSDNISISIAESMIANDENGVDWIEIRYEIHPYPRWTPPGYPDNIIFKSNIVHLDIPTIHNMYSYTKDGPFVDANDLVCMVTDKTGESYVYYNIYGIAGNGSYSWDSEYRVTNQDGLVAYKNTATGYISSGVLNIIPELEEIRFVPKVTGGSSIIKHRTWGDYDENGVVINYRTPNVEDTAYYVPIPTDTAYKDNGYLFGDCSYEVTQQALPAGKPYYKLVITDNRQEQTKTATAYWKTGNTGWQKDDPYVG